MTTKRLHHTPLATIVGRALIAAALVVPAGLAVVPAASAVALAAVAPAPECAPVHNYDNHNHHDQHYAACMSATPGTNTRTSSGPSSEPPNVTDPTHPA